MKKTALAAALLIVSGSTQAATLAPNSAYSMTINATGSCFAFGDCTILFDNVSSVGDANNANNTDTVFSIATVDDGSGGVTYSITSAPTLYYENTAGALFTMTNIGGSGSVDAAGNVSYTPTGRLGAAANFAYLGNPAWNINDAVDSDGNGTTPPNYAPGVYASFTSGTQSNYGYVSPNWILDLTLTGSVLDAGLNTTIVSVSNVGAAWGPFVGTPYSEVWSVAYALTNGGPIANDDSVSIDQGTTDNLISVFADNGNGIDSDEATNPTPILISGVSATTNGGTVTANGTLSVDAVDVLYTPPADLTVQSDSFTYTITDGVFSATATVSVSINDITSPTITLNATDPFPIAQNAAYVEPGADCIDNFDATKPATVGGDVVDTSVATTYVVTYNCSDVAGNAAVQVTRDVVVSANNLPPVITVSGADPLEITVTPGNSNSFTEVIANSDVTCSDDRDVPTLTNDAVTMVDTSTLSSSTVTYNCIDSDAPPLSATPVTRTVNVVDDVNPVVTPNGANPTNVVVGNTYVEQAAVCVDNFDISPVIGISPAENTVDTSTIGNTTTITYTCTDASGNVDVATIDVVTISTGPVITLNGSDPVSVFLDQPYTEENAVCSDDVDADSVAIVSGDTVNTSVVGTYIVRYNCSDSDGNAATEVTRTVSVVNDLGIPVITLNDEAEIRLKLGFFYFEKGATCSDNVDADKNATISGDTVDTDTIGTYTIRYNCTDSAANAANEVTRSVIVFEDKPIVPTDEDDETLSGSMNWFFLSGLIGFMVWLRRKSS